MLAGVHGDRRDGARGQGCHMLSTLALNHRRTGGILGQSAERSVHHRSRNHREQQPIRGRDPFGRDAKDMTAAKLPFNVIADRFSTIEVRGRFTYTLCARRELRCADSPSPGLSRQPADWR